MRPPLHPSNASESTRAWWAWPGFIYFLAAGSPPKAIKIGMAAITGKHTLNSAVARRMSHIQSSNHELLELLGLIHFADGEFPTRDADARERELHEQFRHLQRFKNYFRGAEWFTPAPEIHAFIASSTRSPESFGIPRTVSTFTATGIGQAAGAD